MRPDQVADPAAAVAGAAVGARRRILFMLAIRLPYIFYLGLLACVLFLPPSSQSWCQTCTRVPGRAASCRSWLLADALNAVLGTSLSTSPGTFGWLRSASDAAAPPTPVWTALVSAQYSVFVGYVVSFASVCGILLVRFLPDRIKAAAMVATLVFYYACMLLSSLCALVYVSETLSQWHGGSDVCPRLCDAQAIPPSGTCQAQVTGADPKFWVDSVSTPAMSGFTIAQIMLAFAVLGALSASGLAALGVMQAAKACARACRTAAGARAALLPRNLDAEALGSELRRVAPGNAGVADFVARRAAPSPDPFQCAVCWEDAAAGDMSVDLQCRGVGPGASPHRFCPQCIAGVLLIRAACPLCAQDVVLTGDAPAAAASASATVMREVPVLHAPGGAAEDVVIEMPGTAPGHLRPESLARPHAVA